MASPQVEDGHTKIANEIMGALMRTNIAAYDRRVLDCIFRKTYGWGKKTDRISYSQFEADTGLKRRHIARAIKSLAARNILIIFGQGQIIEYGIQKDYEKWIEIHAAHTTKPLPSGVTVTITSTGNAPLPSGVTVPSNQPLPRGDKPLPSGVTKPLPSGVTTKAEAITKASNGVEGGVGETTAAAAEKVVDKKPTESFESYRDRLRVKYSDIDFDTELEKFNLFWYEGNKKPPKNAKLALRNWMDIARERKQQRGFAGNNFTHKKSAAEPDTGDVPGVRVVEE